MRSKILGYLDEHQDEIIQFISTVVQAPSENPPGDTTQVAALFMQKLDEWGIPYKVVAPQPTMPNIVATIEGGRGGDGRHVVFNGHMDVFPAGNPSLWTDPPFSGKVADGKIWGRGAGDMKAGTSSSLFALKALHDARAGWAGKVTLTAVSDEETFGPWGARYLMANMPEVHGDVLLNGEPSSTGVIRFGEKGMIWFKVHVQGQGCHSAYPHQGRSAVRTMMALLHDLDQLSGLEPPLPESVRRWQEQASAEVDRVWEKGAAQAVLQVTTNCGVISGGLKVNMVAESCDAECDVRLPPGLKSADMLPQIESIISQHPGASMEIIQISEPSFSDPEHALFNLAAANIEAITGTAPVRSISLGGTDSRLWRYAGIPALTYGPIQIGMGGQNEHTFVRDVMAVVKVHALTAWDYLNQ